MSQRKGYSPARSHPPAPKGADRASAWPPLAPPQRLVPHQPIEGWAEGGAPGGADSGNGASLAGGMGAGGGTANAGFGAVGDAKARLGAQGGAVQGANPSWPAAASGGSAEGPAPSQGSAQLAAGGPTPGLQALHAAAAALSLPLLPRQAEALLAYVALLQRWNRVYNLTAVRDEGAMLRQHLFDCLAVLPPLNAHLDKQHTQQACGDADANGAGGTHGTTGAVCAAGVDGSGGATGAVEAKPVSAPIPRILDVGSGGGLPGVVLAVVRPDWSVQCVDTVAKKAGFIRQVAAELPAPRLTAIHARVEALTPQAVGGGFQVITSRAFSSLADFTRLTRHLLADDGCWMAMKGRAPDDELAQLPADVEVFHVEQLQVPELSAQRCLVWMRPRPTPV